MPQATILICNNERCAGPGVAQALVDEARSTLAMVRVPAAVFAVRCLELCQHGPHVVLHGVKGEVPETCRAPDGGVAYDGVDVATMRRIVADHVAAGLPVRPALHTPQDGRGPTPQR